MDSVMLNGAEDNTICGIPYNDVNWKEIKGQPFGIGSRFNLFVLGDANNIVDVEGAVAIGGSYFSPRGLSVGFHKRNADKRIPLSPDLVRYLVGNIVSMKGSLVVIGNVLTGGSFKTALGSTYYIGKEKSANQIQDLKYLYHTNGGSNYWAPSDKGEYYIISSYDVPRSIPASRVYANVSSFFQDAKRSLMDNKNRIAALQDTGTVRDNSFEWVLSGTDPIQNLFTIDVRPNGSINKGIRFEIPSGSLAIVRLLTGAHAHLQYGLYGEEKLANRTLYVFEDAEEIHMEKSSDIWGSILAPQAMFHGHPTGGHVSGNAALGGFAVNSSSGFEFHIFPFVGGVIYEDKQIAIDQPQVSEPMEEEDITNGNGNTSPNGNANTTYDGSMINNHTGNEYLEVPVIPVPLGPIYDEIPVTPENDRMPAEPQYTDRTETTFIFCPKCPECPDCPEEQPCPVCPEPVVCPKASVCPVCPEPTICPKAMECPVCKPCPECEDCPVCNSCPEHEECPACSPCPECEECPQCLPCPICEECLVTAGIIAGCIFGCECQRNHEWNLMLYQMVNGIKTLITCETVRQKEYFTFEVSYTDTYILKVCPKKRNNFLPNCKPMISFQNVGVANLILES